MDSPAVTPNAAAETNEEAGFTSFAAFEAEMAKEDNTGGAASIQNDGGVRDASQIANNVPTEPDQEPDATEGADEAEDTAEAAPVEPTKGSAKGPAKVSLKARVGQLVREKHEADARERAALQRAEDAEARAAELAAGNPKANAAPVSDTERPNPEDFEFGEYDPDYQDALVEYRVEMSIAKRVEAADQKKAAEAVRAVETERQNKWGSVIEKGAEANPDFEEKVLQGTSGWKLSKQLWEMSVDSDVGHEILYHLASDPAESSRIFDLPLIHQAAEFGKLEVRFSQPSGNKPKSGVKDGALGHMPSAPKPTSLVRGAGGQYRPDAGTKDFAAFEAMMKAEEAARART
jgi:hypothetical protein